MPYHDSRAYTSMVPVYATGTRGACHMHGAAFVMEQGAPRPDTGMPVGEVDRFSREGKSILADALPGQSLDRRLPDAVHDLL